MSGQRGKQHVRKAGVEPGATDREYTPNQAGHSGVDHADDLFAILDVDPSDTDAVSDLLARWTGGERSELDRLRAELDQVQAHRDWLQRETESLRDLSTWDSRLLSNGRLPSGVRITAYILHREFNRRRLARSDDGATLVRLWRIAALSGQGRNSVARHLATLESLGVFTRYERWGRSTPTAADQTDPAGLQIGVVPTALWYSPERWNQPCPEAEQPSPQINKPNSNPHADHDS